MSLRSNLILSSYQRLGLPTDLFPSSFPTKTPACIPLLPIRATFSARRILLDLYWIGRVNYCWPSPAESFLVPSPAGLLTIFLGVTLCDSYGAPLCYQTGYGRLATRPDREMHMPSGWSDRRLGGFPEPG
jgi:hypothetical protein